MPQVNALAVAGPHSKYALPDATPAGFLDGLWHGLICPIVFFVSLIAQGVRIYEPKNNGLWYDFGFVIGISISFAGGAKTS